MDLSENDYFKALSPPLGRATLPREDGFDSSLKKTLAASCAALTVLQGMMTTPAYGAIPSFDEFYVTSGTVIRPKATSTAESHTVKYTDVALPLLLEQLPQSISQLKVLIAKHDWNGLTLVSEDLLDRVEKKFWGLTSLSALQEELQLSTARQSQQVELAREDLSFSLSQLADLALSSKVDYFNREDLQQIEKLIAKTGGNANDDIEKEAMQLLDQIEHDTSLLLQAMKAL
eukprot:gene4297-4717_t